MNINRMCKNIKLSKNYINGIYIKYIKLRFNIYN